MTAAPGKLPGKVALQPAPLPSGPGVSQWETQRQRLRETYENGRPWPFHTQTYEFMGTPHFREAACFPGDTLNGLLEELRALDRDLRDGPLSAERIAPTLPLLARHIVANGVNLVYRWYPAPHQAPALQSVLNAGLRAAGEDNPAVNWNSYLQAAWTFTQIGESHPSAMLWTALERWVLAEKAPTPHGYGRTMLTVLNGLAAHHAMAGEPVEERAVRERILKLWKDVRHYLGRNRIVENAVEMERRGWLETPEVLRLYQAQRQDQAHAPGECVRESLLVSWMVWRYTFGG